VSSILASQIRRQNSPEAQKAGGMGRQRTQLATCCSFNSPWPSSHPSGWCTVPTGCRGGSGSSEAAAVRTEQLHFTDRQTGGQARLSAPSRSHLSKGCTDAKEPWIHLQVLQSFRAQKVSVLAGGGANSQGHLPTLPFRSTRLCLSISLSLSLSHTHTHTHRLQRCSQGPQPHT
jgi:hypothetical protein